MAARHPLPPELAACRFVVVLGSGWGAVSFVKNLSATGVDCTLVRCASCSTIVTPR